jgi:hypothetical protein
MLMENIVNRVQGAICTAVADAGLTLAEAAVELGLHRRYLIDFMSRMAPGDLPGGVRDDLARLTGVPAFVFRDGDDDDDSDDCGVEEEESGVLSFCIWPHTRALAGGTAQHAS